MNHVLVRIAPSRLGFWCRTGDLFERHPNLAQQILTAQRLLMVCGTGTRMTWYAVNVAIAYFSDLYVSQPAA